MDGLQVISRKKWQPALFTHLPKNHDFRLGRQPVQSADVGFDCGLAVQELCRFRSLLRGRPWDLLLDIRASEAVALFIFIFLEWKGCGFSFVYDNRFVVFFPSPSLPISFPMSLPPFLDLQFPEALG